jgi:hypothetical protein
MFPNKFDIGIVYAFKVGIIRITFNFLQLGIKTFLSKNLPQF